MKSRVLSVTAAVVAVALVVPVEALAQSSDFGKNIGDQAKGLAVALFLAVAGLVALRCSGVATSTAASCWRCW